MQIEGIPDGWYFVRVGQIHNGEHWVNNGGYPQRWDSDHPSTSKNYVVISKIERPKRYRQFANAAEFEPHRDRWLKCKSSERDHRMKTHAYNDRKHYTCEVGDTWTEMFNNFEFEDGTPFGVEVIDD